MPSSVISNITYDKATFTLKIRFVSGKIYEYLKVPERIYYKFKSARSKGIYFNLHIKDSYLFRNLNEDETKNRK